MVDDAATTSEPEPGRERAFLLATADFWRCPNTGDVILGMQWDDKVLCRCGKPNPRAVGTESGTRYDGVRLAFIGCHVKRLLAPASVDDYLAVRRASQPRA